MKRRTKRSIPTKYTLLAVTVLCVLVMFVSFTLNLSGGPLNTVAGYVFVPMQNGINQVATWVINRADDVVSLRNVQQKNKELQAQVDELTQELNTIKAYCKKQQNMTAPYSCHFCRSLMRTNRQVIHPKRAA